MPDVESTTENESGRGIRSAPKHDHLGDPLGTAQSGVSGSSGSLPHQETIQQSFGEHDVSGIETFTGPSAVEANRSLGSEGMAMGGKVALKDSSLHTAAHEAAHVFQQNSGIQLDGGVGTRGDRWEQHADAVADRVTHGESAAPLLDQLGTVGTSAGGLQFLQTWDATSEDWVDAEDDDGGGGDKRNFKGVDDGTTAAIGNGRLTAAQLATVPRDQIRRIDPFSNVPKNILKTAAGSNWNKAKHIFADGKIPKGVSPLAFNGKPAMNDIMWKLWEYRQRHHKEVLTEVREDMEPDVSNEDNFTKLKKWATAGSVSMTSDIDVNLKGTHTEEAAKRFNTKFKAEWGKEAGTVYDVNVYALDFMHGMGDDEEGVLRAKSEGKRKGKTTGGFDDEATALKDMAKQEEWAMVKVRLYMTESEWEAYKTDMDPDGEQAPMFKRAEIKYRMYRRSLKKKMEAIAKTAIVKPDDTSHTGAVQVSDQSEDLSSFGKAKLTDSEDIQMQASNRIYEAKLKVIKVRRKKLNAKIGTFNSLVDNEGVPVEVSNGPSVEKLQTEIDALLFELREMVSEAALYSNEAYITDGAVNHTVVGLQIGQSIIMKKGHMLNAVTENMADTLKEIGRHGKNIGEASYKASKYSWRMCDAIRNLDLDLGDSVGDVNDMFVVSRYIANTVKGGEAPNPLHKTKEQLAADKMIEIGIRSPGAYKAKVQALGVKATKLYNAQVRSEDGAMDDSLPVINN